MGALDSLVRSIASAKYGRPFYSKLDEALAAIKREKGTAEEFMRELEKQPGVKKAEIEERGLKKALEARAKAPDANKPITKEQMKKILNEQAPLPPVVEDVLTGKKTEYGEWRTPGGEDYREILLKLPEDYLPTQYTPEHFKEAPNLLAHIRVSDFKTPEGKKVLLVDEIQSDWHQAGRREGYHSPYASGNLEVDQRLYEYAQADKEKAKAAMEAAQAAGDTAAYEASRDKYLELVQRSMTLDTQIAKQKQLLERGVPDAPFKKNWHELAMKRVLDYAAEKGYDTVAITPGAEQANRYKLSQHVDRLNYFKNDDGTFNFVAYSKQNNPLLHKTDVGFDDLVKYLGEDVAKKISEASGAPRPTNLAIGKIGNNWEIIDQWGETVEKYKTKMDAEAAMQRIKSGAGTLSGIDLDIGGEGMKGFYDKIIPDYLNNLGKKYGTGVGKISLQTGEEMSRGPTGSDMIPTYTPKMSEFHSFDITPQLREEIKTKGLPLYSAGAGAAGAEAVMNQEEQPTQPQVYFSDSPDTMRMELEEKGMQAGGLAKLAKLARAAPKTKQEIEAIAERIAPQVTGEFVRGRAGTQSVAGKTQKQFAREKDLPLDIRPTGELKIPEKIDIESLKGNVFMGIPGDYTVTGKTLHGVGDVKLDSPSPQHGGPLYGLYHDDAHFWASEKGAASKTQNVAKEISEQYEAPVIGQYIMMGPEGMNYAQHFADANLSAIDLSKMTKRQIEGFNKLIRQGSQKSGPRPSFPGIENKENAYLHMAVDPEIRKHFNSLMQMPTVTEHFNLPSGIDIRYAVTEPELRNLETGVTGFSLGRMRPEIPSESLKLSEHPTYSHDIPGHFMGQAKYPMPYELSFPDTLKAVKENPKQAPYEFGSLKMVGPRQVIDQQMIDEIKQYEEAMKRLTGKKKGGAVDSGLIKVQKKRKAKA